MTARIMAGVLSIVLLASATAQGVGAQLVAAREFRVNVESGLEQSLPDVAMNAAGDFVVVWHSVDGSADGIRGRSFDPAGRPLLGGGFPVGQGVVSKVAMDGEGGFVVAWRDDYTSAVSAQRFGRGGVPRGDAFEVAGEGYNSHAVAMNAGGAFVVAWADYYGQFEAQRFRPDGEPDGDEITVAPLSAVFSPDVAMSDRGDFVVVWARFSFPYGHDVFGQRYDGDGHPAGDFFLVNDHTIHHQFNPAVALAPDGSFVVVWVAQDGSERTIWARRYDAAALPIGPEFRVDAGSAAASVAPHVVLGAAGDFAVFWSGLTATGRHVLGQLFSRDGARVGAEFKVSTTAIGAADGLAAAASGEGDLAVTWSSGVADGSVSDIFARRYRTGRASSGDSDGDGVADDFDNCPTVENRDQADATGDGYGDACVSPDVIIPASARFGASPVIGRRSSIGEGVSVGDAAVLGERVFLDRQVTAGNHLVVEDMVSIGRRSRLGDGVTIGFATRLEAGVTIGDGATIGDQVLIRRNSLVERDAVIEPLAVLFAGVRIGHGAIVEMGARIGRGATVLPGATVPAGTSVPPGTSFP